MTSPVIVVPRGGPPDEHRDRVWDWVRRRWSIIGRIYVGTPAADEFDGSEDEPYNRSQAINRAVADASEAARWDVVVVIDADSIVAPRQVAAAIDLAVADRRAVVAYREYRPLTQEATERILAGSGTPPGPDDVKTPPGVTYANVSGCIVVPRPLWDEVGGFDERFVGWGCEDVAFAAACRVLGGGMIDRVDGSCWHLWHPVGVTGAGVRFRANKALEAEYLAATTPEAMRQVLAGREG
jgi:hypothetical protein